MLGWAPITLSTSQVSAALVVQELQVHRVLPARPGHREGHPGVHRKLQVVEMDMDNLVMRCGDLRV